MALLNDNSLIDLSINKIPEGKTILKPISQEEIKTFDNYKLNQLEKFICKYNENSKYENKLNDNINLIQILGNKFEKKNSLQ